MWKYFVDIDVTFDSNCIINCLLMKAWQFSFVYGLTTSCLKSNFWDLLNELRLKFFGPWIVAGDFNSILDQKDKLGGKPIASGNNCGLRNVLDTNGLINLGFIGYPYTWTNQRSGKLNIREWLDRAFANSD